MKHAWIIIHRRAHAILFRSIERESEVKTPRANANAFFGERVCVCFLFTWYACMRKSFTMVMLTILKSFPFSHTIYHHQMPLKASFRWILTIHGLCSRMCFFFFFFILLTPERFASQSLSVPKQPINSINWRNRKWHKCSYVMERWIHKIS